MNEGTYLVMRENIRRSRDLKFHGPEEADRRAQRRISTGEIMRLPGDDLRPPTMVYFIQEGEGGPVKIGTGVNPEVRLAELQTGNSTTLRLLGSIPGGRREESGLHGLLAQYRVNGEWFHYEGLVVAIINALLSRSPVQAMEKCLRHACCDDGEHWILPVFAVEKLREHVPRHVWGQGELPPGFWISP